MQAMCLAWLAQLMGVTMVHANLRDWLKLFYASICTFVLFGLDQVNLYTPLGPDVGVALVHACSLVRFTTLGCFG